MCANDGRTKSEIKARKKTRDEGRQRGGQHKREAQDREDGRKRDREREERNRKIATTWKRNDRKNDTEEQAILLQALCDRGGDDGNDWLSYLQSDPVMMSPLVRGVEGCLCLTVNCRPQNQEGDDNANIFRRNALVTAGL